jgi:hypothetical protein
MQPLLAPGETRTPVTVDLSENRVWRRSTPEQGLSGSSLIPAPFGRGERSPAEFGLSRGKPLSTAVEDRAPVEAPNARVYSKLSNAD